MSESEIAERARKLTRPEKRQLERDLARNEIPRAELARRYGVTRSAISQFARQRARQIEAIARDIDNEFAGLWIADKAQRILAYEHEYELASDSRNATHHEWIKTRAMLLRNVAEELGQLPNRTAAAIIVPVVHVVEGVELDALKLATRLFYADAERPGTRESCRGVRSCGSGPALLAGEPFGVGVERGGVGGDARGEELVAELGSANAALKVGDLAEQVVDECLPEAGGRAVEGRCLGVGRADQLLQLVRLAGGGEGGCAGAGALVVGGHVPVLSGGGADAGPGGEAGGGDVEAGLRHGGDAARSPGAGALAGDGADVDGLAVAGHDAEDAGAAGALDASVGDDLGDLGGLRRVQSLGGGLDGCAAGADAGGDAGGCPQGGAAAPAGGGLWLAHSHIMPYGVATVKTV